MSALGRKRSLEPGRQADLANVREGGNRTLLAGRQGEVAIVPMPSDKIDKRTGTMKRLLGWIAASLVMGCAPPAHYDLFPRPIPVPIAAGQTGPFICPNSERLFSVMVGYNGSPISLLPVTLLRRADGAKSTDGRPARYVDEQPADHAPRVGFRLNEPARYPATALVSCGPW
jgi:hypothetical protein